MDISDRSRTCAGAKSVFAMKSLVAFVTVLIALSHPVSSAETTTSTVPSNMTTEKIRISVKEIEKTIENTVSAITKQILPYVVRNSDVQLSSQCMSTFVKLFVDIRKLKISAVKLLDAMAKPTFGLLQGTFAIMGDYDECLSIRVNRKGDLIETPEDEYYHGTYCTIEAGLPEPMVNDLKDYGLGQKNLSDFGKFGQFIQELPATTFVSDYNKIYIGVCVPSTCTIADLKEIIKQVPIPYVPISVRRCEDAQPKPLTVDQIIILFVLCSIAAVVITCTCLEGIMYAWHPSYLTEKKSAKVTFVQSFSIYNNTKLLLSQQRESSGQIACINGMYILGIFLVIVYHTYLLPFFVYFSRDVTNLGHYMNDPNFTLVPTMAISIDAYFVFSGLFLVYGRFKRGGKEVKVNVTRILVRRYLRLCPSLLLIIALIIVLPLIGSGPVWGDIFQVAAENSRKWWWKHALMFNNFLPTKDQSFLYLWFTPCLMQLTIVGSILAWFLSKSRKFGIALIVASSLACNVAVGVITFIWKYPPSYAIYFIHNRDHFEEPIYTSPLSHVVSFCTGMLLGYYMSQTPTLKWSKIRVTVGWIVSFLLTVGTQYILYIYHDGKEVNPVHSALYGATHKTLFCLGLSWIILACHYGYGGVLGKIFGWKGFTPLSKLGYFAYLIHYLVIAFHVSTARTQMPFTHYEVWIRIFSYATITFLTAYILYISFELPLNFVESLLLPANSSGKVTKEKYVVDDRFNGDVKTKNELYKNNNYQDIFCAVPEKVVQTNENSHL